ncbi:MULTISPECIES: hypothetical protein [unclassified Streptomyces]|uniref:hypothetical protein n=1 Tax=unclassified Streptomyces TaxID=2593676 RepID=UPI00381C6230
MRPSTWALLIVLVVLLAREPWLLDAVFTVIRLVTEQPWALVALAAGIVIHRMRRAT